MLGTALKVPSTVTAPRCRPTVQLPGTAALLKQAMLRARDAIYRAALMTHCWVVPHIVPRRCGTADHTCPSRQQATGAPRLRRLNAWGLCLY